MFTNLSTNQLEQKQQQPLTSALTIHNSEFRETWLTMTAYKMPKQKSKTALVVLVVNRQGCFREYAICDMKRV